MDEAHHAQHSALRELIVEHLFIGEALRLCWRKGITNVEVLRSEVDSFGYDLVLGRSEIVRHVQLKTLRFGGKASEAKVALSLAEKPSPCVIWIVVTPNLEFDHFLWFGGAPGQPLPGIEAFKVAKHTKGDATGQKAERTAHRLIPRRKFDTLPTMDAVVSHIFGQME